MYYTNDCTPQNLCFHYEQTEAITSKINNKGFASTQGKIESLMYRNWQRRIKKNLWVKPYKCNDNLSRSWATVDKKLPSRLPSFVTLIWANTLSSNQHLHEKQFNSGYTILYTLAAAARPTRSANCILCHLKSIHRV